jgi:hypothetical protein
MKTFSSAKGSVLLRVHFHCCAAYCYSRSGELSAQGAGRAGLRSCALPETLHPTSSRAIKFLGSASLRDCSLLPTNDYFPVAQLHGDHLHGIDFERLHRTGSITDVE